MARIPKTVFISYRRTNQAHAIKIYQLLQESGYDPFLDIKDLGAGAWRVLLQREIQKRAHFVLLLTPSAVQRFAEPNDVMRFEIETALDNRRNLVPLMFDGFTYSDPRIYDYLTGKLSILSEYNAFPINWRRLKKDIQELIDRFMSVHPDDVVHPMMEEAPKRDKSALGGEFADDGIIAPEPNLDEASKDRFFGGLPDFDLLEDEEADFDEQAESVDTLDDMLVEKEKKQAEAPRQPIAVHASVDDYPTRTASKKSAGGAGGIILAILTSPAWLIYKLVQVIRDAINPPKTSATPAPMLDNKPTPAVPPAPKPIAPPAVVPPPQSAPAPGSATGDFGVSRKRKPAVSEDMLPEFERAEASLGGMTEADLLLMMRQAMASMPPVSDEQLAMEEAEEFEG